MRIHALTTGTVRVKESFLNARTGPMRQPALFLPGEFSDPLPIHLWLVEDDGRRILVDTGETAGVRDIPFARFSVRPEDELPAALASIGLTVADVDTVVLTHMHGDHMDGAAHLGDTPVLVHDAELAYARSAFSRLMSRLLHQPIPDGVRWEPYALADGPFGAFAASRALGDRVRIVATPGHTPGHVSVLCVDDDGRHVLLAGDLTDTLEQLHARRPDAVGPKPKVHVESLDRVLAHAREHPTVYLPSHDPQSGSRLTSGETISASRV
jgi:glyoxylase-like metal-dependent hydrolase (beta-lactamase superfamily II)